MQTKEQRMRAYIARTPISDEKFSRCLLQQSEMCAIYDAIYDAISADFWEGLHFAFEFGLCRGYRAAKAEVRR